MRSTANSNKEKFKKFYDDFKKARANETDNYKLIRCRSERLDQLLNELDTVFQLFDKRIQDGKTYCLVFDSKTYYECTCALIKEHIKEKLDSNKEYYVKGDLKSITVKNRIDQASNVISKIIVPNANWPALEKIRLTLSPNNYAEFMESCRTNAYFIDSIILKIDPLTSVDEEMELLEEHIKPIGLKPFIVFNDLSEKEFTQGETDRYRNALNNIKGLDFTSRERIFTGFSRRSYYSNIMQSNKNFEKFKKAIEDDLTMDAVYGRLWSKARLVMTMVEDIGKTIAEDKSNIIDDLTLIENKLKTQRDNMISTIQKSKHQMQSELEKVIKELMSTENERLLNIELLQNNIVSVIDTNYDNFRIQFDEQIVNTIKTDNINFDKYVSDIYFNEYMKKTDYHDKLKDDIDKCLQEIKRELEAQQSSNESSIEGLLSKIKRCVSKIYDDLKSAFHRYVGELKGNLNGKYEKTCKELRTFKDTFDCNPSKEDVKLVFGLIESTLDSSKQRMKSTINTTIKTLLDDIQLMRNIDLLRNNLTRWNVMLQGLSSTIAEQLRALNDAIQNTWPNRIGEKYSKFPLPRLDTFKTFVDNEIQIVYGHLSNEGIYNGEVGGGTIGNIDGTSIIPGIGTAAFVALAGLFSVAIVAIIKWGSRDPLKGPLDHFRSRLLAELDSVFQNLLESIIALT